MGQLVDSESTSSEEGFLKTIEREFCRRDIKDETGRKRHVASQQRKCRKYMAAANNAGLTSDHKIEDARRLRQMRALDNLTLNDLSKARPDPSKPTASLPEPPPPNLGVDFLHDLVALREQAQQLRDDMSADVYETVWLHMHEMLEAFTGTSWMQTADAVYAAPAKKGSRRK